MSPAAGWLVLSLVFIDELLFVAAAWVTGASAAGWAVGAVLAMLVVFVWWAFASPKAPYGGRVVRPVVKVLVMLGACGGLWLAGHPTAAAALLVFSVFINALAMHPSVSRLVDADV